MLVQVKGETVDKYLGYHYYINSVMLKSKHKRPYVAVSDSSDTRVVLIYIETQEIDYYSNASGEVKRDEDKFKRWIRRNYDACVKVWDRLNPQYPVRMEQLKKE